MRSESTMIVRWAAVVLGACVFTMPPARADDTKWNDLESQFRTLPMEAKRNLGPLYWLHGDESPAQLVGELERVAEGGNGMFTAESRPHADWLGPGWFRDLKICLDAAKRLNLQMWIFDERWWPSGEVGGKVPRQYGTERLWKRPLTTLDRGVIPLPDGGRLIAVLAARVTSEKLEHLAGRLWPGWVDPSSVVDLTSHVRDGRLNWSPPEGQGRWQITVVAAVPGVGRDNRILVNGASKEAVAWYLNTVYQPHFDRFGDEFGKTIQGYFYDEPETPGDFGPEVIAELTRRGIDWKAALLACATTMPSVSSASSGTTDLERLPMGVGDSDQDAAYKLAYREALAEAWGRTMYGGIAQWCHDHHVRSFGHYLEHSREYLHDDECAGDMVQLQKYSDMGAIDAVFRQFVPGKKDHDTYVTPKLGSSISHAYGKTDDLAMVEIYGARGQDLPYPEMKWWADHMQVNGINVHIPHSFNPKAPYDVDCPPYFYHGGYEPRWPLYRVYADYVSRLSLLLTGGRHVAPVAVLYAGQGYHVQPATTPEVLTTALQDARYDCDWVPYDAFASATIDGKSLALHGERYSILVVPAVSRIAPAVMEKVKAFYDAGGIVVAYGRIPSKTATPGRTSAEVEAFAKSVWGTTEPIASTTACATNPAGGRAYFWPEAPLSGFVQVSLKDDARITPALDVVDGDPGEWLHILHRQKEGRDVFLVCNLEPTGSARSLRIRVQAPGIPEVWDAMRNEQTSVAAVQSGDAVEFPLTLEPLESVLIVFRPEGQSAPLPLRDGKALQTIAIERRAVEEGPLSTPVTPTDSPAARLAGGVWVWSGDVPDALHAAPPGERHFRRVIDVPADRPVTKATAILAADNSCSLAVNGQKVADSVWGVGDWQNPIVMDLTRTLRPGPNVAIVTAVNASDHPNPAGLLGVVAIEYASGPATVVPIDATWKTTAQMAHEAHSAAFDDSTWPAARVVARVGEGPWGDPSRPPITLSPIDRARTFVGSAKLANDFDPSAARVDLVLDALNPEAAARVTINGHDAGGLIGPPLRLDVSRWLQPGDNEIRITPFAPSRAELVVRER
jgi:hypothetical protein